MNNLTEEVGNLKIEEPKFEKWNELSSKLKLECMKSLDFRTRWNLRRTSKTEKSLADCEKFKFDAVLINSCKVLGICQNGEVNMKLCLNNDSFVALIEYILHHGIIENLKIEGEGHKIFASLTGQYSVKNSEFNCVPEMDMKFWVGKMNDKLKSFTITKAKEDTFHITGVPKIMNVHSLTIPRNFYSLYSLGNPLEIFAPIWIRKAPEIGRKFQVMAAEERSFEFFLMLIPESIISQSKKFARIKTNDPEKHILLEVDTFKAPCPFFSFPREHLRMTVIPASLGDNEKFIEENEDDDEKPEDLKIAPYQLLKWTELPKEIKLECIKWLDIRTRMNLRRTTKDEKSVVDSKKLEIDYAKIDLQGNGVHVQFPDIVRKYSYPKSLKTVEEQVICCEYLLEHGTFESLDIDSDGKQCADLFHEANCQYSVKHLKFNVSTEGVENIEFFLGRMSDKLESLDIQFKKKFDDELYIHHLDGFPFVAPNVICSVLLDRMFASPNIPNIPLIKICHIENTDTADKLANIWIQKDANIGTKYQVSVRKIGTFEGFAQNFKDRLVLKSVKFIRIKTANPSKHILLQVSYSDARFSYRIDEILQMTVIPAELKACDIDEEWVRDWKEKR